MKKDQLKNVDVEQCIYIIVGSLIAALVAFIPATFGESFGIKPLYKMLPILGDGSFAECNALMSTGFASMLGLDSSIAGVLLQVMNLSSVLFFAIIIANIVFSLVLIIFRSEIARKIFKIISIFAGFIMLATALIYIIYLVGFASLFINGQVTDILPTIDGSGILVAIGFIVFGFILTGKQFKWYSKLY